MSAVHLCIDMQVGEKAKLAPHNWDAIKQNNLNLIAELEARHIPTVYIAYIDNGTAEALPDGVGYFKDIPKQITDALRWCPDFKIDMPLSPLSLVAFKEFCSAFDQDEIASYVHKNDYSHIILSGFFEARFRINGCCVSETARDFSAAGYEVTIVAETTNLASLMLPRRQKFHPGYGVAVKPMADVIVGLDADQAQRASRVRGVSREDLLRYG